MPSAAEMPINNPGDTTAWGARGRVKMLALLFQLRQRKIGQNIIEMLYKHENDMQTKQSTTVWQKHRKLVLSPF